MLCNLVNEVDSFRVSCRTWRPVQNPRAGCSGLLHYPTLWLSAWELKPIRLGVINLSVNLCIVISVHNDLLNMVMERRIDNLGRFIVSRQTIF
jgi:hypothetical protein